MSGEVYPYVGAVVKYWREKRMEKTPEEWVEKLNNTTVQLDFPGGPYGKRAKLSDVIDYKPYTVEEHLEWETGRHDMEFYCLLLRDMATALKIPTRRIVSTTKGNVGANVAYYRKELLEDEGTQEKFADKLRIPVELLRDIEEGKNLEFERTARIFSAMAVWTEEPIFNFFRPGHHIPRRSLQQLKEDRERWVEDQKAAEAARKAEQARIERLKAEKERRLAARKAKQAEAEAKRRNQQTAAAEANPFAL